MKENGDGHESKTGKTAKHASENPNSISLALGWTTRRGAGSAGRLWTHSP